MKTLDDLKEQIQEDIQIFWKDSPLRLDDLCQIVVDRINEFKDTEDRWRGSPSRRN